MNERRTMNILLVEDNPGDVRLTQEAFKQSCFSTRLQAVKDGVEALQFLRKEGEFAHEPTPDLILLDLNLPRKNGIEVLKEVKKDDSLKQIPVIILTTSSAEEDIQKAYAHHANCYLSKPVDFEQFHRLIQALQSFWFSEVHLPAR